VDCGQSQRLQVFCPRATNTFEFIVVNLIQIKLAIHLPGQQELSCPIQIPLMTVPIDFEG